MIILIQNMMLDRGLVPHEVFHVFMEQDLDHTGTIDIGEFRTSLSLHTSHALHALHVLQASFAPSCRYMRHMRYMRCMCYMCDRRVSHHIVGADGARGGPGALQGAWRALVRAPAHKATRNYRPRNSSE